MKNTELSARGAALALLDGVIGERRLIAEMLSDELLTPLTAGDRARAQRLANDTLRGLERADRLLRRHLHKAPPLHVNNILRLATVELSRGGDAHGIVNDFVELLAHDRRHAKFKGLVNAVLRKVAADGIASWHDLRLPRLPKWLRAPLVDAWGAGAVAGMERAHFAGAPLDITAPADAAEWAEQLNGVLLPTGSIRVAGGVQVSALPGYAEGAWWVQDAAAALAARVLAAQPDEDVLDLCAAPGGKTLQLAAAGARVTALDMSARRMERVAENLERTGLQARCVTGDALDHAGGPYDAILLDAPCSATGTIRRHPDLPFAKDGSDFGELIDLQSAMMDHALTLLRPGGRLVFCTCSLLPDEGECQLENALERHEGLSVCRDAVLLPGVSPEWITPEGGLRLRPDYWPDTGGMDGFFIACLQRPSSA